MISKLHLGPDDIGHGLSIKVLVRRDVAWRLTWGVRLIRWAARLMRCEVRVTSEGHQEYQEPKVTFDTWRSYAPGNHDQHRMDDDGGAQSHPDAGQ